MNENENKYTIAQLIKRGGIFYDVPGDSKKEIMSNLIKSLHKNTLPPTKHDALLQAVMEREALISTGIDNGIALPHPRTPMLCEEEGPFVTIAFPSKPMEWGAPDNNPVHTLFLIVSASPKQHLNALTKINFLCMDNNLFQLISSRVPREQILLAIEETEKFWR